MRSPDELLASALRVLDRAFATPTPHESRSGAVTQKYPDVMAPLFSGGHDSTAACHVASKHPKFDGTVHHIATGIGSRRTRAHVEETCREMGWGLKVWRSPATYEKFVTKIGFPGPGGHSWVYAWLKDRCVGYLSRGKRIVLVTGCRSQESTRRMGHVEDIKVGEWKRIGKPVAGVQSWGQFNRNRYWVAPCHDWSKGEQNAYMEEHDLPKNPVKLALGMSGECFCGAFASPGEYERIRHHCPDVADEIDRLAELARAAGKPCKWGTRPPGKGQRGVVAVESGPLCSSCDLRAAAAGVVFAAPGCSPSPS